MRLDNEEKYDEYLNKKFQEQTREFLRKAKVGDIVFCTLVAGEVKVLEMPSEKNFHKVKCLTRRGEEEKYYPDVFIIIKTGNFCAEHLFEGKGAKGNAEGYQLIAQEHGFRTEVVRKGRSYLLKVYGDSQEEVDDYMTYSVRNDLDITFI